MLRKGYHPLGEKSGFILKQLPSNIYSEVKEVVDIVQSDFTKSTPYNHKLLQYNPLPHNPILEYHGECWVNFQEKYEYNPLHNHSGVFSYVIWYQLPFYLEDELQNGVGSYMGKVNRDNFNGKFYFYYPSGEDIVAAPLSIDKKMEGYMAMFPSSLNHAVYPFYTSDNYRITISGNIYLKK